VRVHPEFRPPADLTRRCDTHHSSNVRARLKSDKRAGVGLADFSLPPELKTELERIATTVAKTAGSTLFRRGDQVLGAYLVRSGKVKLSLESRQALHPSRVVGTGCIVGLPATMSGAAYSLTATVEEDAELGFVPRESFLKLIATDTSLCFQAMDLLGQEIAGIRSAMSSQVIGV
jgi:CRP-like cAMP-binding protein